MVEITDVKNTLITASTSFAIGAVLYHFAKDYWITLLCISILVFVCTSFGIFYDNRWGIYSGKITLDKNKVLEMYNSKEMTKSKIKFTEWLRHNSLEKYAKQIALPKEEQDPFFNGVDEARRFISDCFRYIQQSFSEKEIKSFVAVSDVALLVDKVRPVEVQIGMNLKKNPGTRKFIFFKELYKKELELYNQQIKAM